MRRLQRVTRWMRAAPRQAADRPAMPQRRRIRKTSHLAFTADHSASTSHAILQSLLTLYCLIMLMLGVVVPISDALATPTEHSEYRQIFYMLLHIIALIGIVYMSALISYHNNGGRNEPLTLGLSSRPEASPVGLQRAPPMEALVEYEEANSGPVPVDEAETQTPSATGEQQVARSSRSRLRLERLARWRKRLHCRCTNQQGQGAEHTGDRKIFWSAVGVNLYLRFGAMIFGFGVMVHIGSKISDVLTKHNNETCSEPWFLPRHIIDLLLITAQTFFLFKHHRVTINTHMSLVRFVLVHLAVTNLCIWVKTVVYEIKVGLTYMYVKKSSKLYNNTMSSYYSTAKPMNFNSTEDPKFVNSTRGACSIHLKLSGDDTSVKLGPYLYPCAVEYGLICAAICYKIFTNVGNAEATPYGRKDSAIGPRTTSCHKSHRGLFLGLILTICVLVPMISLLVMQNDAGDDHMGLHIIAMLSVECLMLACTAAMALAGTVKAVRQLRPFKLEHHEAFDVNLLFIGLAGIACYNLFVTVSVGACIRDSGDSLSGCGWGDGRSAQIAKLTGLRSLAEVLQSVAQTLYIMQAIQRKVTRELVERMAKPGRGLAVALLVANLAMWVASVFDVKRDIGQEFLRFYFKPMPWSIIKAIFQPMIIFYRFHSTVCLSEIWVHSYKLPKPKKVQHFTLVHPR